MESRVINNDFYDELNELWYTADNHPIALLRAENMVRTPWVDQTIKRYFSDKSCVVLDIGCGAGFLANRLAEGGHKVTGIDLSEKSLQIACQKDVTQSVKYKKADAYALPFPDASFDVVSAMDLLEHVEEPQKVISEAARLLKPGGLFFFHTFNRNPLSWLVVIKGVEWFVANTPKHMHLYRLFIKPKELATFCERHHLKVQTVVGLNPAITSKPLWKLLFTRRVPKDFCFRITSSSLCGYMGCALKT